MKAVTKVQPYTLTCAIAQVVGELEALGQEPRISDISTFLGCSKPTAKKYLTRCVWSEKLVCIPKPYHGTPSGVYTYALGRVGKAKLNSDNWLAAKRAVLEARGIL